jgi:prepilin-type N-terminal cleavage/methylation domain-containing protein
MTRLRRGFTLVELIVVIATIGILATITVIGLTRYQADTRDARRASSVNIISESLEKYYDENGEYPSCSAVSAAPAVVTEETLQGVSADALQAPQAPSSETNSIECDGAILTLDGTDFFEYEGDGSPSCNASSSCLRYTLKYKDESSGEIVSLESRRNASIATSGAATITVSDTDFDNITVSWTAVPNASSYVVQRSSSAAFTSPTEQTVTGGSLSEVMTGLATATSYYFRVRPDSAAVQGVWSNTVSATTLNIPKPVCTATANSNSQITTTWNSVSTATSYNFQYSLSPSMTSPNTTNGLSAATLSQVRTGLSTGVTYYFQVMAVNASFNSGWSLVCQATTFVPVPTGLAAVTDSSTQITASWNTVSVATSYTLQYSESNTFTSPTSITGITGLSQAATGLTQGKAYYFRVYALVGATSSAASSTATATTTVNTPSSPGIGAYSPGSVRAYSAGGWIAWINSPASGNWYYSYGQITSASCPAGTSAQYNFGTQYNDPTTSYGTGWTGTGTWYMVRPNPGFKIKFWASMRCAGSHANSSSSGSNQACASNTGSNVACF